jgi:hypothetical protein
MARRLAPLAVLVGTAFLAVVPSAGAAVVTNNSIPASELLGGQYNPCTDDVLEFDGEIHIVEAQGTKGAHLVIQWNGQGVTATSPVTGATYRLVYHTTNELQAIPAYEQTTLQQFAFISPGPADNFYATLLFKYGYNASGELVVVVENVTFDCRG